MASLAEIIGSFVPLQRSGAEWESPTGCPFEQSKGGFIVAGEQWRCVSHSCHEVHGNDALGFLRMAGIEEAEAKAQLENGHDWTPTLTKPAPGLPRYGLHRALAKPEATVLITDNRAAAKVAERLLPKYCVCVWPDGGERWGDGLEPLRGRTVLLWPERDPEGMRKLEAVIADPDGLDCKGKVVVGVELSTWVQGGDELVAAAKAPGKSRAIEQRGLELPADGENPSHLVSRVVGPQSTQPPPDAPEAAQADAEPPPADFPADATPTHPRRSRPRSRHTRPPLSVVSGNAELAPNAASEELPVEMGEDHLALEFAALHHEDWRYTKKWAQWHHYDGDGWRGDETELIDRLALEFCRSAANWFEARMLTMDGRRKIAQRRTAFNVRDASRNDRRIAATSDQWDTDAYLLGCPGGAIDLRTGKLLDGARESYISMRTAIAPAEGAPTQWLSHLEKVLTGDQDTIGFLRRYCGYLLTGDVGEHCLVYLAGSGRNGKGTVVETVMRILGDYGYPAPFNLLTESRSERHPTELAALRGKRAVSASEPPEGARWDDARIRWLTGGDAINARGMRQDPYTFLPTHKLLLMGNNTPSLRSVDPAIQARFRIIEFNYFFPPEERDIHFLDKLRAEWPQILNWMIQGCMEWQDCGLGLPEAVQRATDDYMESETIGTFDNWLAENTVRSEGTTKSSEAYENYARWVEHQGSGKLSHKSFSKKLKKAGFQITKAGVMVIKNLSLTTTTPAPHWQDKT